MLMRHTLPSRHKKHIHIIRVHTSTCSNYMPSLTITIPLSSLPPRLHYAPTHIHSLPSPILTPTTLMFSCSPNIRKFL